MSGLLDSRGNPVSSQAFTKSKPTAVGEVGTWSGNQNRYGTLPGGGMVQFDLDALTIPDYRAMRNHYQVNASLAVLSFMQHQSDFHVIAEGEGGQKVADECERQLRAIWTPLNRGMSAANWAGYGPNALQWENNPRTNKTELTKIKDLYPEDTAVNWKRVDAWKPPGYQGTIKVDIYDGIKQVGTPYPLPVDNSFWYPLLMENGNYLGRNLLKAAFQPWYFSTLIHLFANRYYERFGEPIVVGRAPFTNDVQIPGPDGTVKTLNGLEYMLTVMQQLRNRSVVALPDDKTIGSAGRFEFDYDIKYLESTMRGADWESYLTRLDEEISIGLFTPILLLRTADVGSYNLGVGHMQMYLWMINAMNDDRKQYIDKYILARMADFNFGPNSPRPKIVFRKLGNQNAEVVNTMIGALVGAGKIKPDIKELGEIAGMNLTEIKGVDLDQSQEPAAGDEEAGDGPKGVDEPRATEEKITARVSQQVQNAFAKGTFGNGFRVDMGFKRTLYRALEDAGLAYTSQQISDKIDELYSTVQEWSDEVCAMDAGHFEGPSHFMTMFSKILHHEVTRVFR